MSSVEIVLGLVMLVGLVGVIVPVLPGLLLMIAAGVLWAIDRGGAMAWSVAIVMAAIGIAGMVASSVLPEVGCSGGEAVNIAHKATSSTTTPTIPHQGRRGRGTSASIDVPPVTAGPSEPEA